MEFIIGLVLGLALIVAAVQSLLGTLQSNVQNVGWQGAAHLAQDWFDKIAEVTAENWHNLYDLSKGPTNHYRLRALGADLIFESGNVTSTINNVEYTLYFYVDDTNDLSVEKATVVVDWQAGLTNPQLKLSANFTRSQSRVFRQSDWTNTACTILPVPFADHCTKTSNIKVGGGRITIN